MFGAWRNCWARLVTVNRRRSGLVKIPFLFGLAGQSLAGNQDECDIRLHNITERIRKYIDDDLQPVAGTVNYTLLVISTHPTPNEQFEIVVHLPFRNLTRGQYDDAAALLQGMAHKIRTEFSDIVGLKTCAGPAPQS